MRPTESARRPPPSPQRPETPQPPGIQAGRDSALRSAAGAGCDGDIAHRIVARALESGYSDHPPPTRRSPPQNSLGHAWYRRVQTEPEADTYLAAVEEWRNVWRPARVKVLLVAESHVRESHRDNATRLRLPADLPTQRILPTSCVRLIYSLGYVETGICVPPPESNPGTDFWEFFKRLALTTAERAGPEGPTRGNFFAADFGWDS